MKQWKQDVQTLDELKVAVQGSLYDAAKLAVKVSGDPEWRAETKLTYDDAIDNWLSKHLSERFKELKAVLSIFPRKDQWEGKAFWRLKLEAAMELKRQKEMDRGRAGTATDHRQADPPVPEQPTRKLAEPESFLRQNARQVPVGALRTAVTQRDDASSLAKTLEEEVARLRDENRRLAAQLETAESLVRSLRVENSDLRSRLARPKVTRKPASPIASVTS